MSSGRNGGTDPGSFSIVGYVFKKLDYPLAPLAPLVLALVLGDRAEDAFRQSMLASRGGLGIFWSNGLVDTIMAGRDWAGRWWGRCAIGSFRGPQRAHPLAAARHSHPVGKGP